MTLIVLQLYKMVGVTVHATVLIVMQLSATVTCMNLPEKFVNRVMQDVIAEIIEDEYQNLDREELMSRAVQTYQNIIERFDVTTMVEKADVVVTCMTKVAEMNTTLNYKERVYLDRAFDIAVSSRKIHMR